MDFSKIFKFPHFHISTLNFASFVTMNKPYIVGITGGSASGKTLFLRSLIKSFNSDELCLVSQDEYYKNKDQQPLDEKGIQNYDTPFSIDIDQFNKDLQQLISGQEVNKK